jgi:hypothetical protein
MSLLNKPFNAGGGAAADPTPTEAEALYELMRCYQQHLNEMIYGMLPKIYDLRQNPTKMVEYSARAEAIADYLTTPDSTALEQITTYKTYIQGAQAFRRSFLAFLATYKKGKEGKKAIASLKKGLEDPERSFQDAVGTWAKKHVLIHSRTPLPCTPEAPPLAATQPLSYKDRLRQLDALLTYDPYYLPPSDDEIESSPASTLLAFLACLDPLTAQQDPESSRRTATTCLWAAFRYGTLNRRILDRHLLHLFFSKTPRTFEPRMHPITHKMLGLRTPPHIIPCYYKRAFKLDDSLFTLYPWSHATVYIRGVIEEFLENKFTMDKGMALDLHNERTAAGASGAGAGASAAGAGAGAGASAAGAAGASGAGAGAGAQALSQR